MAKKRKHGKDRMLAKKDGASTLSLNQPSRLKSATMTTSKLHQDKDPEVGSPPKKKKKFLTADNGEDFSNLLMNHYQGFVHVPADQLQPSHFHKLAKSALERLRDSGYYQYDVVRAGGKHASRTFVKRTLVGEPGITYKYLGLRLFAHPWSGVHVSPVLKDIGKLNQYMMAMTQNYSDHGRCDYNLTLINFMEPASSHASQKIGFKDEADYGMGKVSVSWHADSSLEPNSSIGVYHCLPTQRVAKWDWRIALRPIPEGGSATMTTTSDSSSNETNTIPPVAVSTEDGDAYFLLGRFNETHQHCVLAGSEAHRISSTHRVAVTKEDTWDYIRRKVKGAIQRFRQQLNHCQDSPDHLDPKVVVYCQRVLTEVEMDWIAQYWLQGAEHDKKHTWWQAPMRYLESQWAVLEEMTWEFVEWCRQQQEQEPPATSVPRLVLKGFLLELERRRECRKDWEERRSDKIYQRRISAEYRPVARPIFPSTEDDAAGRRRLPQDLGPTIENLTLIRKQQVASKNQGKNRKTPDESVDRPGSETQSTALPKGKRAPNDSLWRNKKPKRNKKKKF